MNKRLSIYATLIGSSVLALSLFLSSCSGKGGNETESLHEALSHLADTLPQSIHHLTQAVKENNPEAFAKIVSYPLERPYPLKSIQSPDDMVKYYPTLVDDSLRNIIANTDNPSWEQRGWRGWTIDNGKYLWIDDSLYQVTYISKAETEKLRKLLDRDSISVMPGFRKGWKPVTCLKSTAHGTVYRIDHNPKARHGQAYRLAVWKDSDNLKGKPTAVFTGQRQEEGTAGTVTYFFATPDGGKAVYAADITDLYDRPRILFTNPNGTASSDTVVPAYWLDLVND